MGRLLSKFSPSKMANTAKKLLFGSSKEQAESEGERSEYLSYDIQGDVIVEDRIGKRKREIQGERSAVRFEGSADRAVVGGSGSQSSRIKLFGQTIEVGESSGTAVRERGVERVFSLRDLIRQDRLERSESKRVESVRVEDCMRSPGLSVMEGAGDNYAGEHLSPAKQYKNLFQAFLKCCSPPSVVEKIGDGVESDIGQQVEHSVQSSGTFSFLSPLSDTVPYNPVEEWWSRFSGPSLQYSVTAIDPYMPRHPIWMERYESGGQTSARTRKSESSAGGSFSFPKLTED